ncbi:MAG: hypothetical protein ACE5QF_03735 [Thermoplasmata archaeon]
MAGRESCDDYTFHKALESEFDDGLCVHCSRFLTVHCPHIDEFMEEETDNA